MKKGFYLIFLALAVLAVIPFMSAATTLVSPTSNGNYSGTMLVNCTTAIGNALNATFWYNTGTSNSSLTVVSNTSAGQTVFNQSAVSIASLPASLSYNFFCQIQNATAQENSSINTGITVDNTAPTCSITLGVPNVAVGNPESLNWSSSDNLQLTGTNVSITGPAGFTTVSYTDASLLTSISPTVVGSYSAVINATDRASNLCTNNGTFTVYQSGYSGNAGAGSTGSGSPGFSIGGGNSTPPTGLIIVGIIVVVLYFILKKK